MNKICLIGNICNNLDIKKTQSGKSVCSFNLAVRRPFAKDVTDFISVVVWNKQAEILAKYCGKGSKVGVMGALTSRKYQDKEGNDRTVFEVSSEEVEFLDAKTKQESAKEVSVDSEAFVPVDSDELPF